MGRLCIIRLGIFSIIALVIHSTTYYCGAFSALTTQESRSIRPSASSSHPLVEEKVVVAHEDGDIKIAATTTISGIRRREMFHSIILSPSIMLGSSMLDISTALAATNAVEEDLALKFCGKFSDPINHPGGTRTITLIDSSPGTAATIGDYRLARVTGGGGRGEPKEYVLPAIIAGDRAIIIDFSPKGGPRDFTGVLDTKDGSIKFLRDGNRWPRLE
jgi:hypothetical protein